MKVFISQPMSGFTDKEILTRRIELTNKIKKAYPGEEIKIIDSFIEGADLNSDIIKNAPVFYLAKSLTHLSDADLVFFANGWRKSRGCKIEKYIAEEYEIPTDFELLVDLEIK